MIGSHTATAPDGTFASLGCEAVAVPVCCRAVPHKCLRKVQLLSLSLCLVAGGATGAGTGEKKSLLKKIHDKIK